MRLPFRARTRTSIDLHLNAALQPMHRGVYFSDPIENTLRRIAPGSRVADEGSVVDEWAEVVGSDIRIEVTGDAAVVLRQLTRTLEHDYFAPRGSYALLDGERHEFGTAEGVAIRLTPALPIDVTYDSVPSNIGLAASLSRVDDLLRGHGQVMSWMLRETRTSAYLYGRSARFMSEVGTSVLSSRFPDSTITVETIA